MSKRIGYIRVSTLDQNPERQLEGVSLDKKFVEYASGSSIKRPQLEIMMDYIREDDFVIVHSMDRLARNVKDLRNLIDDMIGKGVKIQFMKENLIFTSDHSPMSNLLLMVMGAIAEFEHSLIRERQREGIALAKKAGKYKGKKKKLNEEKIQYLKDQIANTRKTRGAIAKELGISRVTLYEYLKKSKEAEISNAVT